MKLKKLASVAMAGVMAVSLAACGGSDTAKTTAADATTAAETTAAAEDAEAKETEASEAPAAGGIAKEDLKIGFVYIGDENEGYTAAHYNGDEGKTGPER